MAARAGLQLSVDQQITTPIQFYEWTSKSNNLPYITARFSPIEDYNNVSKKLDERYKNTKTISGNQKLHCIIPDQDSALIVKEYSNSSESKVCKLFKRQRK